MEDFIVKEVEAASSNMTAVHGQALSSPWSTWALWLTRAVSCVLKPPPWSAVLLFRAPDQLEVSQCVQPLVVLSSSKEHFGLPSGAFDLREDVLHVVAYQESCHLVAR